MTGYPYRLTGPIGMRTMGLIVLQVDETIEQDFRRLLPPDVALYVSRVPSGAELTPETIASMEAHLPAAAALLPPAASFDVVAYACTSGTALIGPERVAGLVNGACSTAAVTDPLTASIAALRALRAERVALVSPYIETVADPIRRAFEGAGLKVPATLSFGEEVEARVARIDPDSIRDAAREAGRAEDVDAVFLSCTNMRTLDVIDDLEAELAMPVVSSNLALAWHMACAAGAPAWSSAPGRLFSCPDE